MFTFKIRRSTGYIMEVFMIGMEGYYAGRNVPAYEAAEYAGINPRSLSLGYQRLLLAGIIVSTSGQDEPGYRIGKDPKDITLLEVMKALEHFPRVKCRHKNEFGEDCMVCGAVNRAMDHMEAEYAGITLYDYYLSLKAAEPK